jgi:hypothetical protein
MLCTATATHLIMALVWVEACSAQIVSSHPAARQNVSILVCAVLAAAVPRDPTDPDGTILGMFQKWRVLRKEALRAEIQRLKAALAGLGGDALDEEDYGEQLEAQAAELTELWQKQLEEHQQHIAAEEAALRAAPANGDYEYEDDDAARVHQPGHAGAAAVGHEAAPPLDPIPVTADDVGRPGNTECSEAGGHSCGAGAFKDEL